MMYPQPYDFTMTLPDYLEVWVEFDPASHRAGLTFWCHRCRATNVSQVNYRAPFPERCLAWTRDVWGLCRACGFYPELAQQRTIQVFMAANLAAAIEGQRQAGKRGIRSGGRIGLEIPLIAAGPGIVEDETGAE